MFRSSFQEERVAKDSSKLQAVFTKLSGVLPRTEDFQGNNIPKIMSSDIIESVLADTPVPVPTSKFPIIYVAAPLCTHHARSTGCPKNWRDFLFYNVVQTFMVEL